MSDTDTDSDDPVVLSGEYVLGVLDSEERAAVEARMDRDPEFNALVWQWADRLAALADGIAPVTPRESVRQRIVERLFADGMTGAPAPGAGTAQAAGAGLWQSLAFWRGAAAALGIAALVLIGVILGQGPRVGGPSGTIVAQTLVASLQPPSVEGILSVEIDPETGMAIIEAANLETQDLYTELWVIPPGGDPVSMGVFPASGESRLVLPESVMALIDAGVALAVTLEPEGGAPDGNPTGPVIAIGQLRSY